MASIGLELEPDTSQSYTAGSVEVSHLCETPASVALRLLHHLHAACKPGDRCGVARVTRSWQPVGSLPAPAAKCRGACDSTYLELHHAAVRWAHMLGNKEHPYGLSRLSFVL